MQLKMIRALNRVAQSKTGFTQALQLSTVAGVGHSGHLSAELRNQHDAPAVDTSRLGLKASEKYAFDLNGFVVLRSVFSKDDVARANAAVG